MGRMIFSTRSYLLGFGLPQAIEDQIKSVATTERFDFINAGSFEEFNDLFTKIKNLVGIFCTPSVHVSDVVKIANQRNISYLVFSEKNHEQELIESGVNPAAIVSDGQKTETIFAITRSEWTRSTF